MFEQMKRTIARLAKSAETACDLVEPRPDMTDVVLSQMEEDAESLLRQIKAAREAIEV